MIAEFFVIFGLTFLPNNLARQCLLQPTLLWKATVLGLTSLQELELPNSSGLKEQKRLTFP